MDDDIQSITRLLQELPDDRRARLATQAECSAAAVHFQGMVPDWYWSLLRECPLADRIVDFVNGQAEHAVKFLDPAGMVLEAESIPGSFMLKYGYVPIGECIMGSGNPYFARFTASKQAQISQIFHDGSGYGPELTPMSGMPLSPSLRDFLAHCASPR